MDLVSSIEPDGDRAAMRVKPLGLRQYHRRRSDALAALGPDRTDE